MKTKNISIILLIFFILLFYIWMISVGLWTAWPATTNYYDQLASAFQQGQLNLLQGPDPRLLQLEDPYNPATRGGIPTPLDMSLYDGKYYLYWGATPGVLLSIFKPAFPQEIGDQYLVFIYLTAILILESLIILKLKSNFFSELPHWITLLSVATIGLITPIAWIFNNPRVYDVAIAGGQLFFLAGFYTAINILNKKQIRPWTLSLIGVFWALTIGSRLTQAVLIAFMCLMILWWIFEKNDRALRSTLPFAVSLGTPLALGFLLICWYNYERFGSITETGFKYAMSGPYLQSFLSQIFLPVYIPQNLYNYVFNPINLRETYPFLKSSLGHMNSVVSFIKLPKVYTSDEITGCIYSAPFTLFALLPIMSFKKSRDDQQKFFNWIVISLAGSFVFAFAPLLMFFWLSTRYMLDFFPQLMLLSILGFWQGYEYLKHRPLPRIVYSIMGIMLALVSIIVSNALGLSSHTARIKAYNPELWQFLTTFFAR